MARVVPNPAFPAEMEFACGEWLDHVIGPLITADMIRYAPERTGRLRASIGYEVHGVTLVVYATAPYAAWVELGHRVFHPSREVAGPDVVAPEPYIRPAVYKYRTPEVPDPAATFPIGIHHPGITYRTLAQYESEHGLRRPWMPYRPGGP